MVEKKIMENTKLHIDGHIHFYDNFSPELFFKSAEKNFSKVRASNEERPVLIFTEGKEKDFFNLFKSDPDIYKDYGYTFYKTDEANSLLLKKDNKDICHIIQGRQIVTKENIEILSIGTTEVIPDGQPSETVIDRLIQEKKPAVLAWGFGKWLFKREKIVKKLIADKQSPYLFIGDNSARPVFWGTPELYKFAEKQRYKIINGSDPLPLSGEEKKPGSFGFSIEGNFDPFKPAESITRILISKNTKIHFFGKRDGIIKFFTRQIKMNLSKYFK